jgi:hypothetical protein
MQVEVERAKERLKSLQETNRRLEARLLESKKLLENK